MVNIFFIFSLRIFEPLSIPLFFFLSLLSCFISLINLSKNILLIFLFNLFILPKFNNVLYIIFLALQMKNSLFLSFLILAKIGLKKFWIFPAFSSILISFVVLSHFRNFDFFKSLFVLSFFIIYLDNIFFKSFKLSLFFFARYNLKAFSIFMALFFDIWLIFFHLSKYFPKFVLLLNESFFNIILFNFVFFSFSNIFVSLTLFNKSNNLFVLILFTKFINLFAVLNLFV